MKITEKTRRFIRSIALIVLPITLILSLSSVILKVYTQYTEDKLFKELSENISVAEKVHDEHSIDSSVSSINSENVTPAILSEYSELHNENPDLYGWLQINDTVIDYPVMYSPYDPQLYLYKNFYKEDSKSGTPFILTPSSTNTIIYGHNMKNASMFSSLLKYKDIEFWKTHRYIIFNTLTSKGIYEISIVANENCYHPIQDVLNSLVWDGTPRIRSCLHHFLGADESDYVEEMLKHFLLGAIRRVFRPGSKYEEMLCLVGGQGAGKSTFFRLLAIRDEWFSDDLKKLDDDRVFQKLQGHWIIEMSEMLATSSAKSIEEIRSFISRQKETYRTPYESQPKDRLRQCVFGGSSNTLDFLPLDRAGNRRFLPIMIYPENAEVHILEDEDASRAYLLQVWAEAMSIYHSGKYSMKFSKSIQRQLVEVQKDFMPEDTEAGQIQGFLEHYTGNMVCSKQLFKEALGHTFDEPKRWQLHNINEIMNTVVTGWKPFSNPRMFAGYGRQKGWERDTSGNELPSNEGGFVELSEEECRQLELPQEWIA